VGWTGLVGLVACGGNSFSAGSSSDASVDSAREASTLDAATDAVSTDSGPDTDASDGGLPVIHCGPATTCSGATPICCVTLGATAPFACAHENCGCETQLACRRKGDCPGAEICCATKVTDANCPGGHVVSNCGPVDTCAAPSHTLCDPSSAGACGALTCKTDATSLMQVGLPPNNGFGVCGS
jgi:hypothetical protein